jgi:hypothetical protein
MSSDGLSDLSTQDARNGQILRLRDHLQGQGLQSPSGSSCKWFDVLPQNDGKPDESEALARLKMNDANPAQEATTQSVNFPEDEPHIIARMLTFLYTNDYQSGLVFEPNDSELAQFHDIKEPSHKAYGHYQTFHHYLGAHARLYAIADKYGIEALKYSCQCGFYEDLVDFVTRLLPSNSQLPSDHAKGYEAFVDLARIVYSSTPSHDRGLRDLMVWFVQFETSVVQHPATGFGSTIIRSLMYEEKDLAYDLATTRFSEHEYICTRKDCGKSQAVLLQLCEEGFWDCQKQACLKRVQKTTWCMWCLELGTLRRGEREYKGCTLKDLKEKLAAASHSRDK